MKHLLCAIAMLSISGCASLSPSEVGQLADLVVKTTGDAIDHAISNKQGRGYTSTTSIAESTPLCDAANRGNRDTLEALLAGGADVNARCRIFGPAWLAGQGKEYGAPLHAAVFNSQTAVAEALLDHGAEVNAKDTTGSTPLSLAVTEGKLAIVQLLLAHGADVNVRGQNDFTPLHLAALRGDAVIVEQLLAAGAAADAVDGNSGIPLDLATDQKVIEILRQKYQPPRGQSTATASNMPPPSTAFILAPPATLCDAANRGDLARARKLIAKGANVNEQCRALVKSWSESSVLGTPLHAAIFNDAPAVAELLVDHGANVNAKNEENRTPLHAAAMTGNPELVTLLLAHGAEVNVQDLKGRTPLHEAVFKGDADVARLLLEHGAKTNIEDQYGMTAMRLAADPQVIELLKQQHASKK